MNCPKCGGQTFVLNSRERPDGAQYRRRECLECMKRFSTVEKDYETKWGQKKKKGVKSK